MYIVVCISDSKVLACSNSVSVYYQYTKAIAKSIAKSIALDKEARGSRGTDLRKTNVGLTEAIDDSGDNDDIDDNYSTIMI